MKRWMSQLLIMLVVFGVAEVRWASGAVFVSGHDPLWHANFGGNQAGAAYLAQTAIAYGRNGSAAPFLFIESTTVAVPVGNAREAGFLDALGYAGQYDVMNGSDLAALPDFRATLNAYSAIVVASDHGGMLTATELAFLNGRAADLLSYHNAGGGIVAFAESNAKGLIGATPRFGFLPFLATSADLQSSEIANTVTAFGSSLGLTNADVNGNFSHNIFTATGGMTPVDLRNGDPDQILSLAIDAPLTEEGVVPEPASFAVWLLLASMGVVIGRHRRRR